MPITVPGNPFSGPDARQSTQAMGLHAAPETKYGKYGLIRSTVQNVDKEVRRYSDELDKTRVLDAMNQLKAFNNELDDNPETGWKSIKGSNALKQDGFDGKSLPEYVMKQYDDKVSEIRGGLNVRQRQAFDAFTKTDRALRQVQLNRHMVVSAKLAHAEAQNVAFKQATDDMASGDETKYIDGRKRALGILQWVTNEKGTDVLVSDHLSEAHYAGILAMVSNGNREGAKKALSEFGDEIKAGHKAKINEAIKKIEDAEQIQKKAEEAKRKAEESNKKLIEISQAGMSDADIIAELRKRTPDATDSEIMSDFRKVKGDMEAREELKVLGLTSQLRGLVTADMTDVQIAETVQNAMADEPPSVVASVISKLVSGFKDERALEANRMLATAKSISNSTVSDEDVKKEVDKAFPKATDEEKRSICQTILEQRLSQRKRNEEERSEQVVAAYKVIDSGGSYIVDVIGNDKMTDADVRNIQIYEARKKTDSLVTDSSLFWELTSEPDMLNNMSVSDLYAMAHRFAPEDFQFILNLKAQKIKPVSKEKINVLVADELKKLPSVSEYDKNPLYKAAANVVARAVAREYNLYNGGKIPENDEEVRMRIREKFNQTFKLRDSTAKISNPISIRRVIEVATGSAEIAGTPLDVIDAGLRATGIGQPHDLARREFLLGMLVEPRKPVQGAAAMCAALAQQNKEEYDAIVRAYDVRYGTTPGYSEIIRAYLEANLFTIEGN